MPFLYLYVVLHSTLMDVNVGVEMQAGFSDKYSMKFPLIILEILKYN